jgi:DHA1 family tetracycline resistance protein-like MFS transporter
MSNKKSPLIVIFFTVFIDLVGFGIIIPLSPYLASQFGASPLEVGLLQASYSLMQFLFSPMWGRLSDRIGRRPVILLGLAGSSLSYLAFAFAPNLALLFVARIFAGIFGATISTAMAYIADITTKENRSKGMGLIGAAFGLGFIFGPLIGGLLSEVGSKFGSEPPFGMSFSALGGASICAINFLFALKVLPETLTAEVKLSNQNQKTKTLTERLAAVFEYLTRPQMGALMIVCLLSGLGMAHMESALGLFVKDQFGWQVRNASYAFAFVGFMMVFTQGYLIRKLRLKFGDASLMRIGLTFAGIGISMVAIANSVAILAIAMTALAIGMGLSNPSIQGTISQLASENEQGAALGVVQSVAALGRIFGPALGGFYYGHWGHTSPFWAGGICMFLGLVIVLRIFSKLPNQPSTSGKSVSLH